jgi:hypothetical protein
MWSNIVNFEADDITAPELAVDGEIEHCKVANLTVNLQHSPDRPDMFGSKRRFRSY